ncbi:hypothetical protein OHB41_45500 [Streptomyces sp. NBC_01571]|nr:hypothetical protein [Streptomyces sp. NBC_01571]MCX4580297.1 hypothetical protein [Streptomyces sp. NBC_01571]
MTAKARGGLAGSDHHARRITVYGWSRPGSTDEQENGYDWRRRVSGR